MSISQNARVPPEASAEDVAQLIAALDRTALALSQTSVSVAYDGTFILNIPLGSFVVRGHQAENSETVADAAPVDLTANNVGPTPAQIVVGLGQQASAGGKWYCVTRGINVGVFRHSDEVTPLTQGVPASAHKKYDSLALAIEAYTRSWNNGNIRRL